MREGEREREEQLQLLPPTSSECESSARHIAEPSRLESWKEARRCWNKVETNSSFHLLRGYIV